MLVIFILEWIFKEIFFYCKKKYLFIYWVYMVFNMYVKWDVVLEFCFDLGW